MSTMTVNDDGVKVWRLPDGRVHREDGPAVIQPDGTREWWWHDKRHRDDGPAVVRASGTREWWWHDKHHRDDGPAVVRASGTREWWWHGERHREDGPAAIWSDGTQEWWIHGQHHRMDGPAFVRVDGTKMWYQNDELHREDGSAVVRPDGTEEWWVLGWQVHTTDPEDEMRVFFAEDPEGMLAHPYASFRVYAAWNLPWSDLLETVLWADPKVRDVVLFRDDVPSHVRDLVSAVL